MGIRDARHFRNEYTLVPHRSLSYVHRQCEFKEGDYARLKGLIVNQEMNGAIMKLVHYIDDRQKWRIDVCRGIGDATGVTYLVEKEHLVGIDYWNAEVQLPVKYH